MGNPPLRLDTDANPVYSGCMTTTWEQIATDTYASEDWRYVIELRGDAWLVSERGRIVCSHYSLERAQAWVDGAVIR